MDYEKTWHANGAQLQAELEQRVLVRTGRRLRNLAIELQAERVVLRGQAPTYYVKQLAQHGVRELLPQVGLENTIVVEQTAELRSKTEDVADSQR